MLRKGATPKTVRNVMTFLPSVFALAVSKGWASANPVAGAARPKRRREGDGDPDLQFLTISELDAVIEAIPDRVVDRDSRGPVLRLVILAAALTVCASRSCLGFAGGTWTSTPSAFGSATRGCVTSTRGRASRI